MLARGKWCILSQNLNELFRQYVASYLKWYSMQVKHVNARWIFGLWWALATIAGYAVAGAVFGILQWRTLRRQIIRLGWLALLFVASKFIGAGK